MNENNKPEHGRRKVDMDRGPWPRKVEYRNEVRRAYVKEWLKKPMR